VLILLRNFYRGTHTSSDARQSRHDAE
jgi:hypothetical protein